jgi:hypothetical protein
VDGGQDIERRDREGAGGEQEERAECGRVGAASLPVPPRDRKTIRVLGRITQSVCRAPSPPPATATPGPGATAMMDRELEG